MMSSFQPQQENIVEQILRIQGAQVFVCGDLILDTYIDGSVSRISPEAPVPVVLEKKRRAVLGGAGNVAANIAALGAKAVLCGRLGQDDAANQVLRLCQSLGIELQAVSASEVPTTTKMRILGGTQQVLRIDTEVLEPISAVECQSVEKHFAAFVQQPGSAKALVLSDYGKGVLQPGLLQSLIAMAKAASIPVITDPKSSDLSRYAGSTVLKPNLKEGRELLARFGAKPPEGKEKRASGFEHEVSVICALLLEHSQAECIVLSLSEHGLALLQRGHAAPVRLPAQVREVSDVSGAGDTMVACLALGLAASLPLQRAAHIGNVASGVVCGKPGTATLSTSELVQAFQSATEAFQPEKILTVEQAAAVAFELRKANRKVVFTNGCFDLLHAGHVVSLQRARSLGDYLVVGLNSDASVRRLKGPQRPIQTERDRAEVLAALACVDAVVVFGSDTPLELIEAVRPDVLAKGGDYVPETIVGAKEVQAWGGKVEVIPLLEGRSTTSIVSKTRGGGGGGDGGL